MHLFQATGSNRNENWRKTTQAQAPFLFEENVIEASPDSQLAPFWASAFCAGI